MQLGDRDDDKRVGTTPVERSFPCPPRPRAMGTSEPTATTQSSMERSPPDSRIRYEVTPFTAGGLKTAPVATLNVEKCQGQLTTSPTSSPSDRGPPRWGHVSSIA